MSGALGLALLAACRANPIDVVTLRARTGNGPRILCVVAHPDDEISFAGTLYKTSTMLDGVCDVAVVTNGEGGYKYATLAESVYGLDLTDEAVGRAHLPAIRRAELAAGCTLLGVRALHFFDQTDHRYTQDPLEILGDDARVWNVDEVERGLRDLIARNAYGFVFVLPPTPETHGHHKAATILALRAVASIPVDYRPVVLCAQSVREGAELESLDALDGFPITCLRDGPALVFDRRQTFGYRDQLDYRIIANWAIAEHRSQGTMQLLMNASDGEAYDVFDISPPDAHARAEALFEALAQPQFEARDYGPDA